MKTIGSEDILSYCVISDGIEACVDSIADSIEKSVGCKWLACINPHSYSVSLSDPAFSSALHDADWLIPDGAGIVFASRVLKRGVKERVTGSDIFLKLHERLNRKGGVSVFFLGTTEETLEKIRKKMSDEFPNVNIAGTYSPPFEPVFSDKDTEHILARVNAAAPDVLWVGMSSPKQDLWIYENRERLNVKFAAAIGAVFDFYTGRIKRSSPAFQRVGLEWLPRLLQEPGRLWGRMLVSAPIFLWHVLLQRLRMKRVSGSIK